MAITLSVTTCVKIEAMNTADYEQPRYREAYLMEWHTRPCQVLHTLRSHSTGTHGHARYYILSGPTPLAHTAMPGTTYSQAPLHWHTRPCQVLHALRPHSTGTHGHARYYILSGPTPLAHTAMPGTTYSQAPLHWHTRPHSQQKPHLGRFNTWVAGIRLAIQYDTCIRTSQCDLNWMESPWHNMHTIWAYTNSLPRTDS